MAITIPDASVRLTLEDGRINPVWLRVFTELANDANTPAATAEDIAYDNTTSSLTADNVQDAVDEVEGRVDDLEANAAVLLGSGTLSGSSVVLATSIAQTYERLVLRITGLSFDTNSRHLLLQVSTDNGSNYDTTAGSYVIFAFAGLLGVASLAGGFDHASSATTANLQVEISGYRAGMYPMGYAVYRLVGVGSSVNWSMYDASTSAINALRVIVGGGAANFDGGAWELYGVP